MKHTSVGAIIKIEDKILMLDRAFFPLGWACPAGHLKRGESPEEALNRIVLDEAKLEVLEYKLLIHEFVDWNECRMGAKGHDWYVYEVIKWGGEFSCNVEAKDMGCFDEQEIMELELEMVWNHWFSELNIIK